MPTILRQAGGATPGGRRPRRGRGATGNWWQMILTIALIATALTTLITRTLPPLPRSIIPVVTFSAASNSSVFNPSNSTSAVISPQSKSSARDWDMPAWIRQEKIMMEAKVPCSTMSEFIVKKLVKKVISTDGSPPASNKLVRHRKEVKRNYGVRKVPFWALPPDEALLYAKREIERASLFNEDPDLYYPVFLNLSVFKRSYELMERILQVYIYPDGPRPIFHTPELQGIYASEGWFMKLIEENRRFTTRDPKRAHLFYLPYSSRQLRDAVYSPGSHNIKPLAIFLREYVNNISSKYPFWNQTRGSDHFLVACHDWGPYSTTLHAELRKNTIKALCNADSSEGIFVRRKDISLPETTIKTPKRPLKYIGGKRVSQRPILAFYAGLMHGRVRPILEKLWGNDTDMRIFRRLPNRVSRNMSYVDHMQSSKFCICPMGYEVNSPRIVEAIYSGCVPVIIADNFVLPFEEVLNWSSFSIVVAEKDLSDLKNILLAIHIRQYLKMQECVKRVQKHFMWHSRPEKYDLFHMILHSIWFSRLNQFQTPQRQISVDLAD